MFYNKDAILPIEMKNGKKNELNKFSNNYHKLKEVDWESSRVKVQSVAIELISY